MQTTHLSKLLQVFSFILVNAVLFSCTPITSKVITKNVNNRISTSKVLEQSFSGFVLYDPEKKEFLYEIYSDKYFTPAPNTKLYTYFAGSKILGDSIPALGYKIDGDSLFFWTMGAPTLLNRAFEDQVAFEFLKNRSENLVYVQRPIAGGRFGAGWSGDDYNSYYSTEKSSFPIYSNNLRLEVENSSDPNDFRVTPSFLRDSLKIAKGRNSKRSVVQRSEFKNQFTYYPEMVKGKYGRVVPLKYSKELFLELLQDTLKKEVSISNQYPISEGTILYGTPLDTLYRKMLQPSDNFLAEQILLMCSATLFDTLDTRKVIEYMKENHLSDMPSKPIWVDGSGLSRYNMFTPRTTVRLLEKMYTEIDQNRLFESLAIGGVAGTIRKWNAGEDGEPFIFAKTGTLSNNHCLSGYLKTKSGKVLIFSFMHNHYILPSSEIKKEMDWMLRLIRDRY